MRAELSEVARSEFREARRFFAGRSEQVAIRFSRAVRDCLDRVEAYPEANELTSDGITRRAVVRRFPSVILYEMTADRLIVTSIFHTSRRPRDDQH